VFSTYEGKGKDKDKSMAEREGATDKVETGKAKKRLGQLLEEGGWIKAPDLERALVAQRGTGQRLGEILVENGMIGEGILLETLSRSMSLMVVDLAKVCVEPEGLASLPYEAARKYRCLPMRKEDRILHLAMVDPCNADFLQDLSFVTGLRIRPYLCSAREIDVAIEQYYGMEKAVDELVERIVEEAHLEGAAISLECAEEGVGERVGKKAEDGQGTSMAPIVRLVNLILIEAIKKEASDIHFEPAKGYLRVRFRMDGHLRKRMQIPKYLQGSVVSRVKVMARMDIANKRTPQDGAIRVRLVGRDLDLRVSSLPANYGEKIVLRILTQTARNTDLESLGMGEAERLKIEACYKRSQGMILVTGPTGSGKSTTLHTILKLLRSESTNIVTVEDPIEYDLEGINQVQVQKEVGMDFSSCLRAILRQDPDVIMVGEIRDQETAEVAFRASLTGHLVLSTLHTQDTASTITRLIDIGIKEYLIRSSLLAVVAQRLVRKICPDCREGNALDRSLFESMQPYGLRSPDVYRGKGCPSCEYTGFRGRVGLFEMMVVEGSLRERITSGMSETDMRELARSQGMQILLEDGMEKVSQGCTAMEEVLSVAKIESLHQKACLRCERFVESIHRFCPYCGQYLIQGCSACGAHLKTDWKVCPFCSKEVQMHAG